MCIFRSVEERTKTMQAIKFLVILAAAASEAFAEDPTASRRLVISIPDRKIALISRVGW